MNKNNKKMFKIINKLNTMKTYKDLSVEFLKSMIYYTNAEACWICLVNPATGKIELKKENYSEKLSKHDEYKKVITDIHLVASELLTSNYDSEDALEYFSSISKNELIIEPIIYRDNLLGYVGLLSTNNDFNTRYKTGISVILENLNSRLEIISLYEEIEKNQKERVEFLASISHEFKTPLNSVIGFSDILKEKCTEVGNLKYIDNISKSSRFLLSLIQDVLDLARSQSKSMELEYQNFRPKDVIADIIWSFEEARKEKKLQFSYTLSDVEISADLKRFQQLIYNLISNAVKFSKNSGVITIVTYLNEHKEFVFEIKDSGDGISKKDCSKIFNFFSQVNRNLLKRQQGSGVGLAICETIAKAHGGEINFKSRLNHGSTFWFTIPQDLR
ncbi:MAG: HAMP domain-containing sensor histidine kinase [Candidatus Gastranaerophilales bacterium]